MDVMQFIWIVCFIQIYFLAAVGETGRGDRDAGIQRWGELPVERRYLDTNSSSRVMITSPNFMFSITGTLKNWTVNFGHTMGKVRLQIWRMRDSNGENNRLSFELIGQTEYQSASTNGNGTHTFEIWPRQKIRVAPNDTVGIQWEEANPVYYDVRRGQDCSTAEHASLVYLGEESNILNAFTEGKEYEYTRVRNSECRQYSFEVNVEIKECKQLTATTDNQVEQIFKSRMDADYCWLISPYISDHVLRVEILQEVSVGEVLVNNCTFQTMEIRIGRPAITSRIDHSTCNFEHHLVPYEAQNLGMYIRLVTSASTDYPESIAIIMSYKSKSVNKSCEFLSTFDDLSIPIQSPGFPVSYESNQDLCWVISTSEERRLRIEVVESVLEEAYANTGCVDFVEVFDGPSETYSLMERWCGDTLPDIMTSSSNNVFIRFLSGPYQQARGFQIDVGSVISGSTDADVCTPLQATSVKQFLYSPGYPHFYRNNEDLCWILSAPEGFRIRIKVYDSLIEGDDQECDYDVVVIRDGAGSTDPLLRRWCGKEFPKSAILTSRNEALIQLQTDGSVREFGFYLSFVRVQSDACTSYGAYTYPVELTAHQLLQMSPQSTCIIIQTDMVGYKLRVELVHPMETHHCQDNYIEVLTVSDDGHNPLIRWCNSTQEPVATTKDSILKLRIVTSDHLEKVAFRISYMSVYQECEIHTVESRGGTSYLNSPIADATSWYEYHDPDEYGEEGYAYHDPDEEGPSMDSPVKYLPNLENCWMVDTPLENSILRIRVMFLDLEGRTNGACSRDFLEIRDGPNENAPLLSKECGHHTIREYHTSDRFAFIKFVTNAQVERRGFQIRFNVNDTKEINVCTHVEITTNYTFIMTPGYPNPYESEANLCWTMNATAPLRIQLIFITYNVESQCLDYLEIYDGPADDGIPMHIVCWPDSPSTVESTGHSLFLRFKSDQSVEREGFKIKVRAISQSSTSTSCIHQTVLSSVKTLTSYSYPRPYRPSVDVCWILTTPLHNQRVLLQTELTDILNSSACLRDYIEVLDGSNSAAEPIHKWCGDEIPPNMTTSGRSVFVHFKAGPDNKRHTGFVIHYYVVGTKVQGITPPTVQVSRSLTGMDKSTFYLILAGVIGLVVIIIIIASLVAFVLVRRRHASGNREFRMHLGNMAMPQSVLNSSSDPVAESGQPDYKGVRLNPDGSAFYNTAFENPGYATLPGAEGLNE